MENPKHRLLNKFYSAFADHDAKAMSECYHPDVVFSDPAFGELKGREVPAMWRMLIKRSGGRLEVGFSNVKANENIGSADWTAMYVFSKTGRHVINIVHAEFEFKDGLIIRHNDTFDFAQWARQALGFKGFLLGRTNFLKNKVRQQARQSLTHYMEKQQL